MKYSKIIFMILLLSMITLSACGKMTPEPNLSLAYQDSKLDIIYYGNYNNDKEEDIEAQLKDYMIGKKFEELPIIKYGDDLLIKRLNFTTEEYIIYDYILDNKCNIVSQFTSEGYIVTTSDEAQSIFKYSNNHSIDEFQNYLIEDKNVHCLIINCEIDGSKFSFATLVLN
ncbi:MAG: hypothetical protein N4A76_08625 [Firmicutes bacterium]|jgi:hypothetical protein|nr:hypothetical protein [Bacillota bacterium]